MTVASATGRQFCMRPVAHATFRGIMGSLMLAGIMLAIVDDTARGAGAFVAVFIRVLGLFICVLGSVRVAISAIGCWRVQLRLFATLYALLAVLLALLALAALDSING